MADLIIVAVVLIIVGAAAAYIIKAKKSGVKYIAQPGGSVRDDAVIDCCDKYGMVMAFTGIRLFHH